LRSRWRGARRLLRRTPPLVQLGVWLVAGVALALAVNGIYQLVRKPTELFFPVSGVLYKTPAESWRDYGALFRRYATAGIPPELLAALAQVEASGNPLARTYWRWSWKLRPFEVYRPASSAVGMYQITDSTFAEARHYCVHDHRVVHEGRWDDWHACWFNALYFRVVPAHAVELTAAYLDVKVAEILAAERPAGPSRAQRRHLAAAVHLCGVGAAQAYAHRGFAFSAGERCGDHDPRAYLARVDAMEAVFARLAADAAAEYH
ncbi:MAG: transglycosylase SLT domain-containing protein, partial [Steroidobacteraceae bacterium]